METKTYSVKSSAIRAAKRQGFATDEIEVMQNSAGAWFFCPVEQEDPDQHLVDEYGVAECPHCNESLDNGVIRNGDEGIELGHEFSCMACDGEFGKKINRASRVAGEHSTTESPCEVVKQKIIEMKGASRKEVIRACIDAGVAKGTARTQYQRHYRVLG